MDEPEQIGEILGPYFGACEHTRREAAIRACDAMTERHIKTDDLMFIPLADGQKPSEADHRVGVIAAVKDYFRGRTRPSDGKRRRRSVRRGTHA